jgi:hypothetical protein
MTRLYIFGLLFITTAILTVSCYKDKGNYSYRDINQVVLKTDRDVVNVLLPDSLKVTLTLEQTIPDPAGFSFEWVLYTASGVAQNRRTLDTTQNLNARIVEMPGSYYLMLYAKDRKTGVEFQKRLLVNVLTAYSEGWMVVEENNGACDLSMITPIDTIFRNIYSASNNGDKLPSGTNRIPDIKTFNNDQKVFIISPADMIQVNYSDFRKIVTFKEFFWKAPDPKPQEYFANSFDEMMLNNGKIHCRSLNAPAGPNYLSLPAEGDHYFAPYEIYSTGGYVVYDTISQQFFKLNTSTAVLTPFNNPPGSADFYMNKIGKKLIYTEVNTGNFNAFFKNNNDDSLFAFEYDPMKTNPAIRRFNGLMAPHMTDARFFVSSRRFMHLYYAYDNMIYKLDITAQTAVPVYTFPAGAEIRAMKMYRNLKNSNHPDHNNLIAVATHENGEGKVYYFPIAATGNFVNNTYRKVFTGFNRINEITFKSLK